jgi:hypothetical protein
MRDLEHPALAVSHPRRKNKSALPRGRPGGTPTPGDCGWGYKPKKVKSEKQSGKWTEFLGGVTPASAIFEELFRQLLLHLDRVIFRILDFSADCGIGFFTDGSFNFNQFFYQTGDVCGHFEQLSFGRDRHTDIFAGVVSCRKRYSLASERNGQQAIQSSKPK